MKKYLMILLVSIILISTMITGCGPETIKFSDLNWGSAHFQSEMAKIIAEEGYGYSVELVPGTTIPLTQGLRTGDIDVLIESASRIGDGFAASHLGVPCGQVG